MQRCIITSLQSPCATWCSVASTHRVPLGRWTPCQRVEGSGVSRRRFSPRAASCTAPGHEFGRRPDVLPRRHSTVCAARGDLAEVMLQSRGKGVELESMQLESDLRGKVTAAVEELGCRVRPPPHLCSSFMLHVTPVPPPTSRK